MDYANELVLAVGRLLDGPTDDKTNAIDAVISAYDDCVAAANTDIA